MTGTLLYMKCIVYGQTQAFLLRARVVSHALGCRARRGLACTHGSGWGPRRAPWRVLWASSREMLVFNGMRSASPNRKGPPKLTISVWILFIFALLSAASESVSHHSPSSSIYGSHGSNSSHTSRSFHCRSTGDGSVCVFVCSCVWVRAIPRSTI